MPVGALLCDRFGGYRTFGILCFLAIAGGGAAPLAGCNDFAAAAIRVAVGCCEGPFYVALSWLSGRWFVQTEYSRQQVMLSMGAAAGGLVGFPVSSAMVRLYSWQAAVRWRHFLNLSRLVLANTESVTSAVPLTCRAQRTLGDPLVGLRLRHARDEPVDRRA